MDIFYCPGISGKEAFLSEEESAHCIRVMRHITGDAVQLIDGKGGYYEASIVIANPKHCRLEISREIKRGDPKKINIHIAIAPTKNMDRFEWFVEKSVEIGVESITPLLCHRSERRILKNDRLERLIISTMKQAIIPWHPQLNELIPIGKFIDNLHADSCDRFIAHCGPGERKDISKIHHGPGDALILIGPEGDFSPDEIEYAVHHHFIPVSLSNNRLRTETAGVVACYFLNLLKNS